MLDDMQLRPNKEQETRARAYEEVAEEIERQNGQVNAMFGDGRHDAFVSDIGAMLRRWAEHARG